MFQTEICDNFVRRNIDTYVPAAGMVYRGPSARKKQRVHGFATAANRDGSKKDPDRTRSRKVVYHLEFAFLQSNARFASAKQSIMAVPIPSLSSEFRGHETSLGGGSGVSRGGCRARAP